MKKIIFTTVFTALTIILVYSLTLAAPVAPVAEKDPGSAADAPDSPNLSQDAPVLQPGRYGTVLVDGTYQSPLFDRKGDKDIYKLSVFPGVQFKLKVTPHNGQDIQLRLLNSAGQPINPPYFWMDPDYLTPWDRAGEGFAEELVYIKGVNVSHTEDGAETFYLEISDKRLQANLPADYGKERYTIDYEEQNVPDGQWPTDGPNHPLRAPLIEWGQTYTGNLAYLDYQDCYQVNPRPAVGKKVTVTVKPLDPELDIDIQMNRSFYDVDGALMTAFDGFGNTEVKIGNRKYTSNNEKIKEFHEGGPGFENSLTAYPYYAKATTGSINSDFVYICPELRKGRGRYEFSMKYEDVAGATEPTNEDKSNLRYPPEALKAPTAPTPREKLYLDVVYFGDELGTTTPEEVVLPPTEEPPADTGIPVDNIIIGPDGQPKPDISLFTDYRIGAKIPKNLRDRAKERAVYEIFKKLYGRKPKLTRKQDRTFVQAVAYKLEPKTAKLKKEQATARKFEKVFGRPPEGMEDLVIVKAMAYTRLRVKMR